MVLLCEYNYTILAPFCQQFQYNDTSLDAMFPDFFLRGIRRNTHWGEASRNRIRAK